MTLSHRNRQHAMTALASLAKYQGKYDQWLQIIKRYSLKWSNGTENSMASFERFFDDGLSLDVMIKRVKEMIRLLPERYGNIIKFACLIGLRPAETVESVKLINNPEKFLPLYYKPDKMTLEHFRFPEIFFRQTKKAYVSFVNSEILGVAKKNEFDTIIIIPSYNAIRLACRRKGINMDMRFCRKIFASHLRQSGIQPEVVDMLQGRVTQSVLTRHYLVPQEGLKNQVLKALEKLKEQID